MNATQPPPLEDRRDAPTGDGTAAAAAAAVATQRALLLTDVVDSTVLSQRLGDREMTRLWAQHDRLARDLLPAWAGREIDKSDGMLLLFNDAAAATGYALAYHRALRDAALPFKARAGIHAGPVTLRENSPADVARGAKPLEVEGLAKPIAARVMSVALGGQTLLSQAAHDALGATPRWRSQSHGHWRLAGLDEPIELHEVGDEPAPFVPPPDAAKAYRVVRHNGLWLAAREIRHSLPAERDGFVGRSAPLKALAAKLQGLARLVSILGTGGIGKTRLATRYAWTWLGDYPGGVWFCDLAQARSVDGMLSAVAQGLGITLNARDPMAQLTRVIQGRGACLLILDNFEQVAEFAEATLGQWLDRAAQAKFLVTTRELLGIVGEQALALDSLPATEAVALFNQRAQALVSGDASDADGAADGAADDASAITQLVHMLDGLPLAIELAAARARVMPARALLARMHERFEVLMSRAGRRDRQATLRAAFDWSWELLSPPEKAGLAQLSVFEGGFTLDAAAAVLAWPASAGTALTASDIVHWLVDKSLVRQLSGGRFDLLQSLRDYAGQHLRTEGHYPGSGGDEELAAQRRHGQYFAAFGSKRAPTTGPRPPTAASPAAHADTSHLAEPHSLIAVTAELDNLVCACRRAAARGDVALAVAVLDSAVDPIQMRGPFRLGVELADAVRAIAGDDLSAQVHADQIGGAMLRLCGQVPQAQARIDAAVAGARLLGQPALLGRTLHSLGVLQRQLGQMAEAGSSLHQALALVQAAGDAGRECAVLNILGSWHEDQGQLDQARAHYEAGLRLAEARGERRWEGGSAGNLAGIHATLGQLALAGPLYARAIAIAKSLGDRQWQANAQCNLGLLLNGEGQFDAAQVELAAALAAARDMGHVALLAVAQCNLGLVLEALGQVDDAATQFQAAVALAHEVGDRRGEGQFRIYLGALHARQSRHAVARECLAIGQDLLQALGDRVNLSLLLCARAETELLAGDRALANELQSQAQRMADELAGAAGGRSSESELSRALQRMARLLQAEPGATR